MVSLDILEIKAQGKKKKIPSKTNKYAFITIKAAFKQQEKKLIAGSFSE